MEDTEAIKALKEGHQILETTQTEGWKLLQKILEENVISLDTIQDVKTLRELEARKIAHRALKSFLNQINAVVEAVKNHKPAPDVTKDAIIKLIK